MRKENISCLFKKEGVLQSLMNQVMQRMFLQTAGIRLQKCESHDMKEGEVYTVYTTFSGGYQTRMFFCGECALMQRIAENMAEEPVTEQEDIEEYIKEFFNIVCGHIVAAVFEKTKTAARFQCPEFSNGYKEPEKTECNTIIVTHYMSEEEENAMLLYDKI